jgi:hypothetical protein
MRIKDDVKWEGMIFWLIFTFFFILLISNAHFLTEQQSGIILLVGLGLIVIGLIKMVF